MTPLIKQIKGDIDYGVRIFRFVKRNIHLYLPDMGLLLMLILPPYNWLQFWIALGGLSLLSLRDLFIMRFARYHIYEVGVEKGTVIIKLARYSKHFRTFNVPMEDLSITISKHWGCHVMTLKEGRFILHKQFPVGTWSYEAFEQLKSRLQDEERDLKLHSMFRGPLTN